MDMQEYYSKKYPGVIADDNIGIGCGWGWKGLLDILMSDAQKEGVKVEQVKEKFGTLRFYYSGGSKAFHELVSKIENESESVCECCGSRKDVKTEGPGWIKTLCPECRENTCWSKHEFKGD